MKEQCSSRCSTNVFSRVDLARALRVRLSFARRHRSHDARRSDPASLPPRRDLLGPNLVRGPLSTWQWIAFPRDPTGALFPRRHSCERSRRARSPPPKVFPPSTAPSTLAGASGRAWVRPDGDPGPLDRCLQLTDSVFKDDRPMSRRTSHRHVPTRYESLRIHAAALTSVSRSIAPGCCLPQPPIHRRPSDAPSPAGVLGGAHCPPTSARDLAISGRNPRV